MQMKLKLIFWHEKRLFCHLLTAFTYSLIATPLGSCLHYQKQPCSRSFLDPEGLVGDFSGAPKNCWLVLTQGLLGMLQAGDVIQASKCPLQAWVISFYPWPPTQYKQQQKCTNHLSYFSGDFVFILFSSFSSFTYCSKHENVVHYWHQVVWSVILLGQVDHCNLKPGIYMSAMTVSWLTRILRSFDMSVVHILQKKTQCIREMLYPFER